MQKQELVYLLARYGNDLAQSVLVRDNKSLVYLNKILSGRLAEYVEKDNQGLTQPSAMMGTARVINLDESLTELGFESDIFNDRDVSKELRCDLMVEGHESECRGSTTFSKNKKYGPLRSGKYHLRHTKRLYFSIREKINLHPCEIVSLLFQILYIDSSMFKHSTSDSVNMSQLKEVCPEDVIGEWEVFNEKLEK